MVTEEYCMDGGDQEDKIQRKSLTQKENTRKPINKARGKKVTIMMIEKRKRKLGREKYGYESEENTRKPSINNTRQKSDDERKKKTKDWEQKKMKTRDENTRKPSITNVTKK